MSYRTCAPNPCSLLFYLRTSHSLTQTKLSRICRVNINSICQCELRGAPMTLGNLRRLAEFFRVPMDALARNDFSVVADMPPVEQQRTDAFRNHLRRNRTRMEIIGNLGEDFVAAQEREKLKGTPYEDRINTGPADDKKGVCVEPGGRGLGRTTSARIRSPGLQDPQKLKLSGPAFAAEPESFYAYRFDAYDMSMIISSFCSILVPYGFNAYNCNRTPSKKNVTVPLQIRKNNVTISLQNRKNNVTLPLLSYN